MRENTVRTLVGWIIILGHLALIGIVLIVLPGKLEQAQIATVLLTLGPVATAYFAAVVKTFIRTGKSFAAGRPVNMNYAVVAILIPSVFLVALASMIFAYPSNLAGDVQSLQQWIAGLETALGGTVGFIVAEIFPDTKDVEATARG
jgi:predicted benzoate:H+ symporter BenE